MADLAEASCHLWGGRAGVQAIWSQRRAVPTLGASVREGPRWERGGEGLRGLGLRGARVLSACAMGA